MYYVGQNVLSLCSNTEYAMKTKFKTLLELVNHFKDDSISREYLAQKRWNGKPICPYCKHDKVYNIENGKRYKCASSKCYKKFSVTVGTIFEDSNVPLSKWFPAIYLIASHKKGISSIQLSKDIGVTQRTAWFMNMRIREMLKEKSPLILSNKVEVDETFIGGLEKNKHPNKKSRSTYINYTVGERRKNMELMPIRFDKIAVLGLVERDGKVVARRLVDTKAKTIVPMSSVLVTIPVGLVKMQDSITS
jgi:transposase-like protein